METRAGLCVDLWFRDFSPNVLKYTADITDQFEGSAKQDYRHVWSWKTFRGNIFDLRCDKLGKI